jgi:membrane protein YqaA with SNARE-associated domain
METFVETLDETVRGLSDLTAGLGLLVVAFFDSSLLSLPELNDVLLVYFGARFPENAYFYAFMTVLGSASGASLLYGLARWKGYRLLEKKYAKGKVASVLGLVRRYGALAVVIPSILPPPFPFKIFVLSSGVLGLPFHRFFLALLVGRSFRYFGEAFLSVRYGERAIDFLRQHAWLVLIAALFVTALVVVVQIMLARRKRAPEEALASEP